MGKRIGSNGSWVGWLCASALVLGISGNAYAALTQQQIGAVGAGAGFSFGASGVGATSSVTGSFTQAGAAASPFAAASTVNITNSRHNLGTKNTIGTNHTPDVLSTGVGPDGNKVVIGTNQICVFCHTPHGFNTTQSGPLWNRTVKSSAAYTTYNAVSAGNISSTFDADAPSIGTVSLACLSCHDGTQAMDTMINGPGSGNFAAGGGSTSGVSNGYTWSLFGQMSDTGTGTASPTNSVLIPTDASARGILIGTDLSNDHPISMQYCGGGIATGQAPNSSFLTKYADGSCADRLFNLPTVGWAGGREAFWVDTAAIPDQEAINAGAASIGGSSANPITRDPNTVEIYVSTGLTLASGNNGDTSGRGFIPSTVAGGITNIAGVFVRTKQDLMLFKNNNVTGPAVECATCHDPHTPNNGTFLRVSNNGSGLCLSCHVK